MNKFLVAAVLAGASYSLADAEQAPATPASFPGGQEALTEYIDKNINYPETAIDNMIEGVVTVLFTVDPQGNVGSLSIVRPLDVDLEAEALRIVKSFPQWEPARDAAGKAVSQQVTLPIYFHLPN